jgi:hypothetical protein
VTGFDRHRRNGMCLHPVDIGMVKLDARAFECWGDPSTPDVD